jgi:competence protein ComEC
MGFWRKRELQIAALTAALLGGVVVSRLRPSLVWWVAAAIIMSLPLWRLRLGICLLLVFGLGFWRGTATTLAHNPAYSSLGKQVALVGTIADDPAVNDKNRTVLTLGHLILKGETVPGTLYLQTTNQPLQRGFRVSASGKLTPGFGSTPLEMGFALVHTMSSRTSPLEHLRQDFLTSVRSALPDPLAGFGLGLLIGLRALIPKPLQQTLNAVGLSHLIAVSGYNLTILVQAARRIVAPVSTFVATAASLWMIAGFLFVTGFSASIVRAALVSLLSLGTAYFGYEIKPLTLVCLPALITVAWKPDYLISDVGWQLSFLAFAGVLLLAPLIEQRYVHRPNAIVSLVVESLAAQTVTTPLILAAFGNVSLVAPLANAAILPLVPLAMLLSFATGLVSIIAPVAGAWLALPTAGLLGVMIGLTQWFATWPHANLQLQATIADIAILWALILGAWLILWRYKILVQRKSKHYHFE